MPSDIKILCVDDSSLTRKRFLAAPLREAGYEVFEAVNGEDGLKAFAEHQPDFVITDLLMPVMDGFAFTEALRSQDYLGPIVVISADIQQTSRERIVQLGANEFLNKPFKPAELLEIVDRVAELTPVEENATCK